MAQHHHHRAFDTRLVEGEQADRHDRHVRDRGIGDQLLHVRLNQRDEAGIDDRDHREAPDQPGELRRRFREHRQRETDEAIAAHLQQHARQDDRPSGRRLNVRIGQPGVDRPHRHLDREAGEEGQEQPGLHLRIEIIGHQRRDFGRARLMHHPHHRDQHQHRSEQRVEEEFVGGVDAVRAAPDADDQIHRDEAGFEHDVEKVEILRREDADH